MQNTHIAQTVQNNASAPMQIEYFFIGMIVASLATGGFAYWRYRRFKTQKSATLMSSIQKSKLTSDILIDAIDDGVIIIDKNNNIQVFNPAAEKLTGWTAKDTDGLDYHSVLQLLDGKSEAIGNESHPFELAFRTKATVRENSASLRLKNGQTLSISINVYPLFDEKKEMFGALAMIQDVTKSRNEEQQRAEFISTASHEMRTPVAAIEGYLALALNDKVSTIDSKARGFLEKAHSSTQHLGKLFQDLLTSAKAEDGRLTSHPSVIEISAFTEQLSEDLRFAAQKKNLFMEYVVGSADATIDATAGSQRVVKPLYYVYADPDRLREVITNLFDNAVKYTESGKITLGLTGNNEVVQMYVKDTGPGIPAIDIPHLFQKFYRVDNSTTRAIGGTGLGLFICRKIVELYKGRIWVESESGKGSTFYINLPRVSKERAAQLQLQDTQKTSLDTDPAITTIGS